MKRLLMTLSLLLFTSNARAEDADKPPPQRDTRLAPGTIVLDDVVGGGLGGPLTLTLGWFSIQSSTQESNGTRSKSSIVGFAPSLDVVVYEGFTAGGQLGISRATSELSPGGETTTVSRFFSPRIGYVFRLTDDLVLWPRARVGWGNSDTTGAQQVGALGGLYDGTVKGETWSVGGDASLLFLLGKHAAISAGPFVTYAFEKQDEPRAVATRFDVSVRGALRLMF